MGKYQSYQRREEAPKPSEKQVHPIWRGVGCIFMVVIPIFSFLISDWVINTNKVAHWFIVPRDFMLTQPGYDPFLLAKLLMTLALIFVFAFLFMLITFMTNSMFGAPRYGPTDAPPEQYRRRRR